jgi:hypothetical protein
MHGACSCLCRGDPGDGERLPTLEDWGVQSGLCSKGLAALQYFEKCYISNLSQSVRVGAFGCRTAKLATNPARTPIHPLGTGLAANPGAYFVAFLVQPLVQKML